MRRKALASLGLIALLAAGLAAAGVIPGLAGTIGTTTQSSGFTTGGPRNDFVYEGQTVGHATYGQPWTTAPTSQSGWVQTPLDQNCDAGTLALGGKLAVTGKTATFTPPSGDAIVGALWKSGQSATVTQATWAGDGSSATVTLSKTWGAARIFYCTPAPTSSNPGTVPTDSGTVPPTSTG
ncbi:MAG TPA: hypothetical protein VJ838_14035 [Gaiellaceae bacterium]|nr:hypothetical protein [Gaiellaceae bacterium]